MVLYGQKQKNVLPFRQGSKYMDAATWSMMRRWDKKRKEKKNVNKWTLTGPASEEKKKGKVPKKTLW